MTMRQIKIESVKIAAFGVAIIGVVNLMGHCAGFVGLYTWANSVGMALPTAIALALLGYCVVILANSKNT